VSRPIRRSDRDDQPPARSRQRRRYLVLADGSVGEPQIRPIAQHMAPLSHVRLVALATPPRRRWTYTDGEAAELARTRLRLLMECFRRSGADVEGTVGDQRLTDAIGDAIDSGPADEVIIACRRSRLTAWLGPWTRPDSRSRSALSLREHTLPPVVWIPASSTSDGLGDLLEKDTRRPGSPVSRDFPGWRPRWQR
jgi:hypothetical protein